MDVPFPAASIAFLDGTKISLHPAWTPSTSEGTHYFLEVEGPEGSRAKIKLTFAAWGNGSDLQRHVDIEAEQGLPLKVRGPNFEFEFRNTRPSFYPLSPYKVNGLTSKGYVVEVAHLHAFRLYHEPKPQPSGDLD